MLKEYIRRFAVCILGLALYGLGNAFGVLAGSAGTNAWNTLSIGVGDIFGCSFGVANLIISAVVILVDLIGRGKIGVGTVLNIFIISGSVNLRPSNLWPGMAIPRKPSTARRCSASS